MGDITGANATFMLSITSVFPAPVKLQGFAADDVFDTDPLESTEHYMGVDGILSAGFVFVPVRMGISLQADSASNQLFDAWHAAQVAAKAAFFANAVVILPNVGQKWALINGILQHYQPLPPVKKLLQPRKHGILWTQVSPSIP